MQWNPDAPKLVGPQYPLRNVPNDGPTIGGPSLAIDGQALGVAQRMPSTVSETVYGLHGGIGGLMAGGSAALIEVVPTGSEEPGDVTMSRFVPNASDVPSVGVLGPGWQAYDSGPLWAAIDGDEIITTEYAWITNEAASGGIPTRPLFAPFSVRFNTSGALSGRRILDVRLNFASMVDSSYGQEQPRFYADFFINGRSWAGSPNGGKGFPTSRLGGYTINTMSSGEINRSTMQPWTVSDIQALASGPGYTASVRVYLPADPYGGGYAYYIYNLWLEVLHCAETRKHVSLLKDGLNFNGSLPFVEGVRTPTGGSSFAKVNGTPLTAIMRQPTIGNIGDFPYSPRFGVPYLTGWTDNPVPGLEFHPAVPLNQYGFPIFGTGLGPITESDLMTFGFVVDNELDHNPTSVDSQPYFNARAIEVAGTVQQEFTGATSDDDYSAIAVCCYYSGGPDDLVLTLKRRSDNAVMGVATVSVDDADGAIVDDLSGVWQIVTAEFPTPVALAAVQYYVDCTSGGPGSWYIQALSSDDGGGGFAEFVETGPATYGGTAQQATEGGVDVPTDDLMILLVVPIPPPTGVTAEAVGCS